MGKEWDKLKLWTERDGREIDLPKEKGTERHGGGSNPYLQSKVNKYMAGKEAQAWHYSWLKEIFRVLKPGGHALIFGGPRTYHRMACAVEDAGLECRDMCCYMYGSGFPKSKNLGDGLGSGLKPAFEPLCLARKPISERNIAANVLKWGCGALNIDASRITTIDSLDGGAYAKNPTARNNWFSNTRPGDKNVFRRGGAGEYKQPSGRFPANVLLSCNCRSMRLRKDIAVDVAKVIVNYFAKKTKC